MFLTSVARKHCADNLNDAFNIEDDRGDIHIRRKLLANIFF